MNISLLLILISKYKLSPQHYYFCRLLSDLCLDRVLTLGLVSRYGNCTCSDLCPRLADRLPLGLSRRLNVPGIYTSSSVSTHFLLRLTDPTYFSMIFYLSDNSGECLTLGNTLSEIIMISPPQQSRLQAVGINT